MSTETRDITLPYEPREFQQQFHQGCADKAHAILICARQHGKTELAAAELIDRALNGPEGASYAFCAPFAHQARKIAWPRLKKLLQPLGTMVSFREGDQIAVLPGNRKIHTFGLDNDGIRGHSFRGLAIDEFDDVAIDIYTDAVLPTTASHPDAFILFIGTLKSGGKLWQMYLDRKDDQDWYCQLTKASEAGILTDEQLKRYRREMGDSGFLREFECDPDAPSSNSVLGELIAAAQAEGRVPDILSVQPIADVHTAWDLGINDACSIWLFQLVGHHIHVIGYEEFSGIGLAEIGNRLRKFNYRWGTAVVPHDIKVREFSSGQTRLKVLRDLNIGTPYPLPRAAIEDTLTASRLIIPRSIFAGEKCAKGLSHLKAASFVTGRTTGTVTERIEHDHHSHALDAWRYLAQWVEKRWPSTGSAAGRSFNARSKPPKVYTSLRPRRRRINQ